MGAELQNINQGLNMKVKKEIFENDETRLQNLNYIDCFQTTDPDIKIEIDDNKKLLWNECSQEMYHNFETDNNIYVSVNSDHGKVKLIEIIKVEQEIQNHREQISYLKDRSYLGDDSNYESTELTNEKNEFVIKTEIPSGDMEAGCSYHEDSNIDDFQHISSDQSHLGSYNPPHKYENGSRTQYELRQDSISCRVVSSNRADDGNHTMKHSSTERTHQFDICEKEFKAKSKFREHEASHSSERPHQCGICNKGFKMKENLRNHMISHSTETAYQCNICESRFKDKYHLNVHMIRHDTKRLHKCDMCKKGFKTAGDLRSHLKQHTTDRPHQCNMCEMRFKTMNDLRSHMKYHTTDRPHQCNMCNKGFKTIYLLRQHSLSHSSDRPHRCNVCDKGFKTVYALRRHMERSQLHGEATSELGKDSRP